MARPKRRGTPAPGPSDTTQRALNLAIAGRFKQLREDLGYSQVEVSKHSGIPQTIISAWERGGTMSVPHLLTLCTQFRWNPVYLLLGQGDTTLTTADLGLSGTALSGQSQMLHEVEYAVQQALQQVRESLLRRQQAGTVEGALAAARSHANPRPRKRAGNDGP